MTTRTSEARQTKRPDTDDAPRSTPFDVTLQKDAALDDAASDTATRIIDTARDLVQARGYNAFSYRDLSQLIGIKTSSIHYYFPTKGDLVEAIVARYREKFNADLHHIETQSENPFHRLDLYLQMLCNHFAQRSLFCLCGMLATDAASLPPNARAQVKGFFLDNESWLAPVLEAGRRDGAFRFEGPSEDRAALLFSAMQGAMLFAFTFEDEARLRRAAAHLLDSLRA
jgi:TetR/AcrR family transcriptional repressor of nem operon